MDVWWVQVIAVSGNYKACYTFVLVLIALFFLMTDIEKNVLNV